MEDQSTTVDPLIATVNKKQKIFKTQDTVG